MKQLFLACAAVCLINPLEAAADPTTVSINIQGLSSTEGVLYAGLCTEEGWETYECNNVVLKPAAGTITHHWENVAAGRYGVTLLHDKNENGQMDFNFFGAPKEQWGSSNNPAPRMGPSLWRDASFDVAGEPVKLDIRMQPGE
ncbi:MAG: DUF2141 domain-containing protein [Pseudomonadota bacterium]